MRRGSESLSRALGCPARNYARDLLKREERGLLTSVRRFLSCWKPAAGRKLDGMLARSFQQAWPWPVCWRRYLLRDARRQPVPEIQQLPATGMGWNAQYWLHRLAAEVRPPGRLALACHPLAPVRVPA